MKIAIMKNIDKQIGKQNKKSCLSAGLLKDIES